MTRANQGESQNEQTLGNQSVKITKRIQSVTRQNSTSQFHSHLILITKCLPVYGFQPIGELNSEMGESNCEV